MEKAYNTIDSLVRNTLIDNQETIHDYLLYLHWSLEAIREANFDFVADIITVKLKLNNHNAIAFPSGYVDWVKVAIQYGERIITLGVDDSLSRYNATDDCGNVLSNYANSLSSPNGINLDNYANYDFYNYNGTTLTSCGGGIPYKGFFKVIKERGEIQFDRSIKGEIYLEYISDGMNPNSNTVVNPLLHKYIKAYINSKRLENNDNTSSSLRQEKRMALHFARKNANLRVNSINKEDVINSSRSGFKMTLKA